MGVVGTILSLISMINTKCFETNNPSCLECDVCPYPINASSHRGFMALYSVNLAAKGNLPVSRFNAHVTAVAAFSSSLVCRHECLYSCVAPPKVITLACAMTRLTTGAKSRSTTPPKTMSKENSENCLLSLLFRFSDAHRHNVLRVHNRKMLFSVVTNN